MLNQSFSSDNFRRIFDLQNRKGVYLEADFFPDVAKITAKLKQCKDDFRRLRKEKKTLKPDEYESKKHHLNEKKIKFKLEKEKKLTKHLEEISREVNESGFFFPIKATTTKSGKIAYTFEHEPCSYFASKQVQHNIEKLYKVKQSNRNHIISQLSKVLSDTYPKIIIRTDIKSFYENIPQQRLLNKLNKDSLLTASSKKLISKILHEYSRLSSTDKGIPRGIGISAYLAELYLEELDKKIKNRRDILYYARYVDDIVAIFSPNPAHNTNDYLDIIRKYVEAIGLQLSEGNKTKSIDLTSPSNNNLEYLGYKLSFGTADTVIEPSKNKINRYKERINISLEIYTNDSLLNEKRARQILIKRIRFLTGNTKLVNNKRNALVGVYFSNSLANNLSSLNGLDKYLGHKIKAIKSPEAIRRLSTMSFEDGFRFRRFHKFSSKDFIRIVSVWKYV